jgi:type II secretory pathway pseudopilin PulG
MALPRCERCQSNSEMGDTLIEVLVALVIIGIAGVALLGSFATTIGGSAEHRYLATLDATLKSFVEQATYQIQLGPSPIFSSCATITNLGSSPEYGITALGSAPPSGYSISASIKYWIGSWTSSANSCNSLYPYAPQLITAVVNGPKGTKVFVDFVVEDPTYVSAPAVPGTTVPTTTTTVPPTTTTTVPPATTTTVPPTTTTSTRPRITAPTISLVAQGTGHSLKVTFSESGVVTPTSYTATFCPTAAMGPTGCITIINYTSGTPTSNLGNNNNWYATITAIAPSGYLDNTSAVVGPTIS